MLPANLGCFLLIFLLAEFFAACGIKNRSSKLDDIGNR